WLEFGGPVKDDVSVWETVHGYAVNCGDGLLDVQVQIGEAGGLWFLQTADDGDGGDDCDDTSYPDRESALAAAAEFAAAHDETPDLDDLLAQVCEARGWDVATAEAGRARDRQCSRSQRDAVGRVRLRRHVAGDAGRLPLRA